MTEKTLPQPPDARKDREPFGDDSFHVVGIGASAGGLEAVIQLLRALPPDTGMAFVLVQHLSPKHTSALAEILSRATAMPVMEVRDGPAVEPNHVYVIPPGLDMVITGGRLQLLPRQGGRGAPRPVDQFFRALAEERGHRAVGVVLAGTASDGTLGLEAIKAEGGITFAQDLSAQHEGMPHSAIASGCVDRVLPPEQIAGELVRIARHPYAAPTMREYLQSVIARHEAANDELQSSNEELQSINEELETSHEEMRSNNEGLTTVNDGLNSRNAELDRLNNDLVNVLDSVNMPIVLVGPDLRVRRFTSAAETLLNLVPGDIGRPLAKIKLGVVGLPELEPLLAEVFKTMRHRDLEVRDRRGSRCILRLRPYRTFDNRIDGVVVILVDIEALERAHDVTAGIVATAREPLLVLDVELRVLMASESFYRMFAVSREGTDGRLLWELGNGQWDIPELRRLLASVLPGDRPFNDYEVVHEFEQIGRRTMLLNARRLLLPDDRSPAMILLAIEDITDRLPAQTAMAQLAAIVTYSKDAIISKNLDGIITSWNLGAQDLFGYTAEEMIGQPVTRLIPDDHLDEEPQILERVRRGETIDHYETVRRRKDGSRFDISLTVSPLRDAGGRIVGASKIARDITGRKRNEEALRRSEERFRTLATELAEADRHKNEFLAMLAHELRNPLGPIRNALQIMRLERADGEGARTALEMMERQVRQMVRLVDDLLDVSRISRGRVELRNAPVNLASIVRDAAQAVRPSCAEKHINVALALPAHPVVVNGDAVRLAQLTGNLLNNAVKYTDPGGSIWIAVEREGGEAMLRVRDSGIGIAAAELPRVFDMFMQVDSSLERSGGGLGIGLTLVKTLVELHGGTVRALSAGVGQGSEFVARLPVAQSMDASPPPLRTPEPEAAEAANGRLRILVVDDNRDAAESLAQVLQISGHETHLAHDGLDAVDAAAAFRPDVVLLDIGLPKLNGYDAARRMRDAQWGKGMMVVALTGWGQQEDRQRSAQVGFDAHLVKPVDPEAIMKLLAGLPARQRSAEAGEPPR